ncbi:RNA-binding protein VTS1 [Nicotiana sylvestris]|uniref:RNA-binding protein VTS1 n=1 Tax=Nicotiana sylvestris TaxID=4096 RepID=UPI00388CC29D
MSEFPPPTDDGAMVAHDNVGSKRHRRPSVRLGDIGGYDSSFDQHQRRPKSLMKSPSNKVSKNHHLTNLSSNQTLTLVDTNPNGNSNFMKKFNNRTNVEGEGNGDANLDNVAIDSWKIRNLKSKKGPITKKMRGIGNVNGRKTATRVSEEGPTTDTEARDWNWGSQRNGVKVWLNQLGLGRYASLFEIHEVDEEVLPMLTLDDLKDMGISAVGSRRKMYCSIQNLNKGFS